MLVGGILLFIGFRKLNESGNLSRYVPIDNVNDIPFGIPVMASGTVTAVQPLISPVTRKPCVYYNYFLEREEENKDDKGNVTWEWKRVGSSELQTIPFYIQDTHGKILIRPAHCEVAGIYQTQQFLQPGTIQKTTSLGEKILTAFTIAADKNSGNRERVTEYTIITGSQLNVFGVITMEGDQKFFQRTNEYPLVLSPLSKDQLVNSEKKAAYILIVAAIVLLFLGLFLALSK